MESFLFACTLVVLIIRWFWLRTRLEDIDARLNALTAEVRFRGAAVALEHPPVPVEPPPVPPAPEPPVHAFRPAPVPWTGRPPQPRPAPAPAARPKRTSDDWEALLGGNWLNKIGVFVVVIGLALLLNYAYTHIGPAGRVALSYLGACAMLAAGVLVERRQAYRAFAYGLIGGGWAGLFLTTYAMHAIDAARVLDNPWIAGVLLFAVAAGMIAHSLRYRSQTVTGLAYFIAFVTLGISEITLFSVAALVPLAASLLYIARRNQWGGFARFGLLATYATIIMHKDTGAPLWQVQALFLVYWLLFEGFDLIRADAWLLPLNGAGFLLLSGVKWSRAAPDAMWQFAAGSAGLYLGATILRARAGRWRPAVTLNAALAAAAILLKLEHHWMAWALFALAEVYYLAGVRFRSAYLRAIAGVLFLVELAYLALELVPHAAPHTWEAVALVTAAAFYLNRTLRPAEVYYGYVAAALAALTAGYVAAPEWRGPAWSVMAAAPFALGWWRRERDFRFQGYGLALLGAGATALYVPLPAVSLALAAAVAYGFVQCVLRSAADRFGEWERQMLRTAAAAAASAEAAALVWRLVPGDWLGVAWIALAVGVFEAGLLDQPAEFRRFAWMLAALAAGRALGFDWNSRLAMIDAALLYAFSWRARDEARGWVADVATFPATLLALAGTAVALPHAGIAAAWAAVALGLAEFDRRSLRAQAMLAGAAVLLHAVFNDLSATYPVAALLPAVAILEAAMLRRPLGSLMRMYFSLLAAVLGGALIYREVSGSLLTIAWGMEGVALLAAGFPLRDRVLRLSGLALLAACTGKLFFWDLRNLDTLPRILSFLVLGLLLVAVSWVYTRFRDLVRRML